ncbi:MAG TPA: serine/threonine-protein kinase [Planctomycetota bacterium]|nr:serine/threonine-protein kinase [Planctomycetota bacterium]
MIMLERKREASGRRPMQGVPNEVVLFARVVLTLGFLDERSLRAAVFRWMRTDRECGFPRFLVVAGWLSGTQCGRARVELERYRASQKARLAEVPADMGTNVRDSSGMGPLPEKDGQWELLELSRKDPLARFIGRRVGKCEIVRIVETGDLVSVFEGKIGDDDRRVQVKILRPDVARDPAARARFTREAEALGRVSHPNVASLVETGLVGGHLRFLTTDVGPGEPLSHILERSGRLPPDEVAKLGRRIALGLDAVHAAGVVHRDVRPANVVVEGGAVKLVGFGIAYEEQATRGDLTLPGRLTGHPCFVAPEVSAGAIPTPRADVYSLGILLYAALVGSVPFRSSSLVELVAHHLSSPPPPIARALPTCPPKLAALIEEKLLAKDPAARPTAREVAQLFSARDLLEPPPPVAERDPSEEIALPGCARCGQPMSDEPTEIGGHLVCKTCHERVETLDACAGCLVALTESERNAADSAVFGGHIYCRACTARLDFACVVCGEPARLGGLITGETRKRGTSLLHARCVTHP